MNPLKQGLKPALQKRYGRNNTSVKEVNPLKQGLKLLTESEEYEKYRDG